MKWMIGNSAVCNILFLSLFAYCVLGQLINDPYKILGIDRSATPQQIKQAYRRLARELHPDKTTSDTKDEFIQVKEAYEILSNPERKYLYDHKSITEDYFYKKPQYYSLFTETPNDNSQQDYGLLFDKMSINTQYFEKILLQKSEKIPQMIFFYKEWCYPCLHAMTDFKKLVDMSQKFGIDIVTLGSEAEPFLARRLNVYVWPALVLVLDHNAYVYKESISNITKIIDFVKSKFPHKLIRDIHSSTLNDFLNGWKDNMVRGLIFSRKIDMKKHEYEKLSYLITAFHFRQRVIFGKIMSDEIYRKFKVPCRIQTLLLFNENITHPVANITLNQPDMFPIPIRELNEVVLSHQYLALPRLSSQIVLEELCPSEQESSRKKLCVVLVTDESSSHDAHRNSFMRYARKFAGIERVRFAYIYHKKQASFINALMPGNQNAEALLHIVIFWRRHASIVRYEWIPTKWKDEHDYNNTKLFNTVSKSLEPTEILTYEAYVTTLFDEHSIGFVKKNFMKFVELLELAYNNISKEQILPALSVLGTIVFILAIGYLMTYSVEKEEKAIKKNLNLKNCYGKVQSNPELRIHELRSEKYNGLVRLLKPGCRTILLIMDLQSRRQLIPPFHRAVWPYRKNKTLTFAYMYTERGIGWYKNLLEMSLCEDRQLNINPRNCIGTVLALNGQRKYFCVFHAKHKEIGKFSKTPKSTSSSDNQNCEYESFVGSHSDSDESILLQEHLLDGLSNWLDCLFDGTTQRYHVNYWPEFPIK